MSCDHATLTVVGAILAAAALAVLVLDGAPPPQPDATITLAEYVVAAPPELTTGENVLLVRNTGHAHHNLTVCPRDETTGRCADAPLFHDMLRRPADARDPSFYDDRADSLVVGKRWEALVSFDLPPGRYRLYCAIVGHAANGMETTVTVG